MSTGLFAGVNVRSPKSRSKEMHNCTSDRPVEGNFILDLDLFFSHDAEGIDNH